MLARLVGLGFSLTAASSVLTSSTGATTGAAAVSVSVGSATTGAVVEVSATGATTTGSSLTSGCALEDSPSLCSSFFCSALSFLPMSPPKREARLREAERDLLFLAFFSSSEELEEDEPVRAGATAAVSSPATASVSAALGVASVLFFGAEAVGAASAEGLPVESQCSAELVD
jgi:hypothetical protein